MLSDAFVSCCSCCCYPCKLQPFHLKVANISVIVDHYCHVDVSTLLALECSTALASFSHSCIISTSLHFVPREARGRLLGSFCLCVCDSAAGIVPPPPQVCLAQSGSSGTTTSYKEQKMPTSIIRRGSMCGVAYIFNVPQNKKYHCCLSFLIPQLVARLSFTSICANFSS